MANDDNKLSSKNMEEIVHTSSNVKCIEAKWYSF